MAAARPGATGDLAYLSIGTGIAAGVVLDGQPLIGDNGLAGEIGHCVADPDGPDLPLRAAWLPGGDGIGSRRGTRRERRRSTPARPSVAA